VTLISGLLSALIGIFWRPDGSGDLTSWNNRKEELLIDTSVLICFVKGKG